MRIEDIRESLVIRERDLFLLTDLAGRVPRGNTSGFGLYYRDTRYLSGFEFSFSTGRASCLLSTAELGYSSEQVLTNFSMVDAEGRHIPQGTIEVLRTRVIHDALEETLQIRNYNQFPVDLEVVFRFAADFADIFVVRGFEPEQQGRPDPPVWRSGALILRYHGADGHTRETMVRFSPRPTATMADPDVAFATFRVSLDSHAFTTLSLTVTVDGRGAASPGKRRFAAVEQSYQEWVNDSTHVNTDSDFLNTILDRSLRDLRMLWHDDDVEGGFPAAGTPWYDTLFGRDASIIGIQTLWLKPRIARQCLRALARYQGTSFDDWRDEQPGKILHELRVGELTLTGELPFSPYYGSVDSTPLFLILCGEYFLWTADLEAMRELEFNLRAALRWIDEFGDPDRDGYIEYEKRSAKGLLNQGWKDSEDSLMHADGSLLPPPIRLVEVQAYAYRARRLMARVFSALGDEQTARELSRKAEALAERFRRDFWIPSGFFALAIDGEGRPATSVTSNPGHALWCGIATQEQAAQQVQRLMKRDMFSGWGLRTLSEESPRYNPQAYHNGTVWPHDNSIAVMGMKRYGHEEEMNRVATGLFDAAKTFEYYRLPELFGGLGRSAHRSPVPYPVACRPQGWAAGAFPLITQAMLGLCPDAPNHTLYVVRPILPDWLNAVSLAGLKVGDAEVDLFFERTAHGTAVEVVDVSGELSVRVTERWPMP
jgi:glycogen debranching enzyme